LCQKEVIVTVNWLLAGKSDVVTPFLGSLPADQDVSSLGITARDFLKQNNLVNDHWSELLCGVTFPRHHEFDWVYSTEPNLNSIFPCFLDNSKPESATTNHSLFS
jgi:hypothetical protein